jgi:hypothetical protein
LSTTNAFHSVDVSSANIQVNPGEVYAIALIAPFTPGVSWVGNASNQIGPLYPNGTGFARIHFGANVWEPFTNQGFDGDLGFKTFVETAAAVPEPGTLILSIAGVALLSCRVWRRKLVAPRAGC